MPRCVKLVSGDRKWGEFLGLIYTMGEQSSMLQRMNKYQIELSEAEIVGGAQCPNKVIVLLTSRLIAAVFTA